jgi:hypothetical protein
VQGSTDNGVMMFVLLLTLHYEYTRSRVYSRMM